ncbi:hypothetical protein OIU77_000933 [Salix suchowensis]|uniref:Uncharacterized protein n=1 Tax=Salix suchowensis TaxID=1278906 RepID=A0ABQ9B7X0_9ROSI|nr:hypothetical protein OIU77_000933 [Salix suchowensis]
MPRDYALIHSFISLEPSKMDISWLNSKSDSELSPLDCKFVETRQAAIRLELLRVIAAAREARLVRLVENLRNSTEFSTNEIRAMVDDPATKASKAQMEERKAKEEMTQNSTQIQVGNASKARKSEEQA